MAEATRSNSKFEWSEFDSEAYFQHYYGEPHPDDDALVRFTCDALRDAPPPEAVLDVVDVGTGPSLIPLLCALPRAARLTSWEYSASNVAWLKAELAAEALRPQFQHFWNVARRAWAPARDLPENPVSALAARTEVVQGSIFDLPERRWDAATMFFCAESITGVRSEFEAACRSFARSVRAGGSLIAAFLVGSSDYAVSDRPFPILNISEGDIRDTFASLAEDCRTQPIGIVAKEIRSGYAGMVFLRAGAR